MRQIAKARHPITDVMREPASVSPPEEGESIDVRFLALQDIYLQRRKLRPTAPRRSHFDALLDKGKARPRLLEEQGDRCAFCEQQVRDAPPGSRGPPGVRIAHWQPLADNDDLALVWTNLFASCDAGGAETHCDVFQGSEPPPRGAPSPADRL